MRQAYRLALNGKEMKVSDIITELNALGGKHGIGIVDIVENRVVGMKSRGVYETPGGTILMAGPRAAGGTRFLTVTPMKLRKTLGNKFAQIVYEGKWFTPLREANPGIRGCDAAVCDRRSKIQAVQRKYHQSRHYFSLFSLYSESLASFHHRRYCTTITTPDGFITLFGLPLKVRAMKLAEVSKKNN